MTALLNESRFHQLLQLELVEQSDAHEGIAMRLAGCLRRSSARRNGPVSWRTDRKPRSMWPATSALVRALGHGVPTITLSVEYLRPAVGAWLLAKATVRRAGTNRGLRGYRSHRSSAAARCARRGCYSTQAG